MSARPSSPWRRSSSSRRDFAAHVLDVDVEFDTGKAAARQVLERGAEAHHGTTAGVQNRVCEHKIAGAGPHVELDHVDADLLGGIEGGQRVGGRQGAGSPVADALTGLHCELIRLVPGSA